jgi:hypothetical protein
MQILLPFKLGKSLSTTNTSDSQSFLKPRHYHIHEMTSFRFHIPIADLIQNLTNTKGIDFPQYRINYNNTGTSSQLR